MHEAAFLVDKDARFLFANDEACRLSGYDRDGLWPASAWRTSTRTLRRIAGPASEAELREKGFLSFEGRLKTRDGRIVPVEVRANYFEHDGQGYSLTLVRDIAIADTGREETAGPAPVFRKHGPGRPGDPRGGRSRPDDARCPGRRAFDLRLRPGVPPLPVRSGGGFLELSHGTHPPGGSGDRREQGDHPHGSGRRRNLPDPDRFGRPGPVRPRIRPLAEKLADVGAAGR